MTMPAELPKNLNFHYIKSNEFRVIHAEGVIGGPTPSRGIFLSFFNERGALPQLIEFEVSPEGVLGREIRREGKDGVIREMEVGVLLSQDAAEKIAEFLLTQVKLLKESEPEKKSSVSTEKIQ